MMHFGSLALLSVTLKFYTFASSVTVGLDAFIIMPLDSVFGVRNGLIPSA